jgi:hypothetical protein
MPLYIESGQGDCPSVTFHFNHLIEKIPVFSQTQKITSAFPAGIEKKLTLRGSVKFDNF